MRPALAALAALALAPLFALAQLTHAKRHMVAAGHPLAAQAGLAMLDRGGSAVDAMIATQLVLTLVEPQASGLGGGAFLLYLDGRSRRVHAIDARETAPAGAPESLFLRGGQPMPFREAVVGGRAVGVPGVPRLLEVAHARYGRLPWKALFEPAIQLAEAGFPISQRLHRLAGEQAALAAEPAVRDYFFTPEGKLKPAGTILRTPQLAATLRAMADKGADAFYTGEIARDIVAAVRGHANAGSMTLEDLAAYRVRDVDPLCGDYRGKRLCGMPPSSSGGIAVLQMLGLLSRFDLAAVRPSSAEAAHLLSEAGRLAFADRNRYVGDDRFVDVPVRGLLDPAYLGGRSQLIDRSKSIGVAKAGMPAGVKVAFADLPEAEVAGTSHIAVVDRDGNAVSMSSTIEAIFGSVLMVRGFLLNNQLTDFNFAPVEEGRLAANAAAPGKRPRSSMAPFVVQDARSGELELLVGSAGGSYIIGYVAKALVAAIDWQLDPLAALSLPNVLSRNGPTELERGRGLEPVADVLRSMGHDVRMVDMPSGLIAIRRTAAGLQGGADPRREGAALGR